MYLKVILLFRKQPYLLYRELGRLGMPVGTSFTKKKKKNIFNVECLSCKTWQFYFYAKTLIMRCHLTIWREFMSIQSFLDRLRVLSIGRNPIQVLLIRSDPVWVLSIRSDPVRSGPIRSDPGFVNARL